MKYLLTISIVLAFFVSNGQKPVIDSLSLLTWKQVSSDGMDVSEDGEYFCYTIKDISFNKIMVVQNISSGWKMEFPDAQSCLFAKDNKQVVVEKSDSLIFFSLKDKRIFFTINVASYRYPKT